MLPAISGSHTLASALEGAIKRRVRTSDVLLPIILITKSFISICKPDFCLENEAWQNLRSTAFLTSHRANSRAQLDSDAGTKSQASDFHAVDLWPLHFALVENESVFVDPEISRFLLLGCFQTFDG